MSVFEERISIRKELMEMEGSYRDIAFKIHLKQISIDRIKILITDPAEVEQVIQSLKDFSHVTKNTPLFRPLFFGLPGNKCYTSRIFKFLSLYCAKWMKDPFVLKFCILIHCNIGNGINLVTCEQTLTRADFYLCNCCSP